VGVAGDRGWRGGLRDVAVLGSNKHRSEDVRSEEGNPKKSGAKLMRSRRMAGLFGQFGLLASTTEQLEIISVTSKTRPIY
jgi:hypothetical protein